MNMEKYIFKVWTFRRRLNLWIWWTKEEFNKKIWEKYGHDYDLTSWVTIYDGEYNDNIIWLKEYSLNTLTHELVHTVQFMCEQCWIHMEWEPPAFIYEELFCKIWLKLGDRFKIEDGTESFYKTRF